MTHKTCIPFLNPENVHHPDIITPPSPTPKPKANLAKQKRIK